MNTKLLFFLFFNVVFYAQNNFENAEKYLKQKKYEEAEKLFLNHLKANPNHTKTKEYLGDIAGFQKNWDKAISYYRPLKISFPNQANYWYKYGGALGMKAKNSNKFKALGMLDEIENCFLTATKLDVKHVDSRWALVMLYIELPAVIGGSEKKAQKYVAELLNLSKVDGYLAKGYVDVYFKRYENAEINYKKAHEIGNSKTTFTSLYDLYSSKLKDTNKAAKLKKEYEND